MGYIFEYENKIQMMTENNLIILDMLTIAPLSPSTGSHTLKAEKNSKMNIKYCNTLMFGSVFGIVSAHPSQK